MIAPSPDLTYAAVDATDVLLAKALGVSEIAQVARIETNLRSYMLSLWQRAAQSAVSRASAVLSRGGTASEASRAAEAKMRRWAGSKLKDRFTDDLARAYNLARRAAWRKATGLTRASLGYDTRHLDVKKATVGRVALPAFDLVDEEAVAALAKPQVMFIGNTYNKATQAAIAGTVRETLEASGHNARKAGALIKERLGRELGKVPLPSGWVGSAPQYFEGVAASAMTTARSFGQLQTFIDLGVTRYEIVNPMDRRTCEVCASLNGQTRSVENGQRTMTEALGAENPDQLKAAQPWASNPKDPKIPDMNLPPFHFRCRCAIDVTVEGGGVETVFTPPRVLPGAPSPTVAKPLPGPVSRFPVLPPHATRPKKAFDMDRFRKAQERLATHPEALGTQEAIRQQVNALLAGEGMVSSDIKAGLAGASRFRFAPPKATLAGAEAMHTPDGKIVMRHVYQKRLLNFAKGKGTRPNSKAMSVLVHEAVHGHSPLSSKAYNTALGLAMEEATTELAAHGVMRRAFGVTLTDLGGGYYKDLTGPLVKAATKGIKSSAAGKRWLAALGAKDAEAAVFEAASDASVAMRGTAGKLDGGGMVKRFVDSFKLPPEATAGMSKKQVQRMTSDIAEEIGKAMDRAGSKLVR